MHCLPKHQKLDRVRHIELIGPSTSADAPTFNFDAGSFTQRLSGPTDLTITLSVEWFTAGGVCNLKELLDKLQVLRLILAFEPLKKLLSWYPNTLDWLMTTLETTNASRLQFIEISGTFDFDDDAWPHAMVTPLYGDFLSIGK
jgi:hypothetical protein